MKQKFLRIKVPDTQFDVPVDANTSIQAINQQLSMNGCLWFDALWVPRNAIAYIVMYEMEVQEGSNVADFTKPPQGFKQ